MYRSSLSLLLSMSLAVCVFADDSRQLATDASRVIATHCLECHSGADPKAKLNLADRSSAIQGGENGPAIAPKNLEESLLWTRVDDNEMPPEDRDALTEQEKQTLKKWISAGAKYANDPIDPFQFSSDKRAGYDWWSLQPLTQPETPAIDSQWVRNPIDAFILSKLQENKLRPSQPASARTLVRRLSFDLTGLPPTPEQVAKFESDPSEQAYRQLVDELLDSTHYGERWGRHWLDVARFGESHGFERNQPRDHQWHFRDWVIRAFNADMPYNEFARLQIAGDHLLPGRDGLAAAAFLTAGVHNTVVGGSVFMKKTARQDELEEIAGTVAQTFVGLTVNCARCHDHKFDPISQTEYYQFVSALKGVYHGDRDYRDANAVQEAEKVRQQIANLNDQIAKLDEPVRAKVLEQRKKADAPKPDLPEALHVWEFDANFADSSGKLTGTAPSGNVPIHDGAIVVDGKSFVETSVLTTSFKAKTLEAVVSLSNLDQQGGGVISIQTRDGELFDAIVYSEREKRRWMAGSDRYQRTLKYSGAEETEAANRPVRIAIVYHADGTIQRYRDGKLYGETYKAAVQEFSAGNSVVRFGIRHLPTGGNRMLQGKIYQAKLYDRALSPDEVAAAAGVETDFVSDKELLAAFDDQQRAKRLELFKMRADQEARLTQIDLSSKGKVFTVAARSNPGITRVLIRGNALDEGAEVVPGAVKAVVGPSSNFEIPAHASDADRRKKLAAWISNEDNPLFARVMANRIWHYHFGIGIVETPNDLGYNGGRPSHPKLLDWLAFEFKKRNWSMKEMHRLIVQSSTYRQSSRPHAKGIASDAYNRLLWRRSPVRLDAESLRDAMLLVSGKLNPKQFGPGFRDVNVHYHEGTTYYNPFDKEDDELNRRTVYRFSPRGGRSAILDTFDCPDPANTAPRRTVTTTPLQALALLNNQFALRMGNHFAKRIVKLKGDKTSAQVEQAYWLAYGRKPEKQESELATDFVKTHGLPAFARVLFNSNEFVIIE